MSLNNKSSAAAAASSSASVSRTSSSSSAVSLLNWSSSTWKRWCEMPRMYMKVVPRTKFVLLKVPVSTLYEEKFGGDRNMFTVSMYAERCMSKQLNVTLVLDATSLDLHEFDSSTGSSTASSSSAQKVYFHNVKEWEDYGMDHQSLVVPPSSSKTIEDDFVDICKEHWKEQPSTLIAIYDARGGWGMASYLIAHYMCTVMRAPVHVALATLGTLNQTATGFFDLSLLQKLQTNHAGKRPISFPTNQIPSWWYCLDPDDEEEEEEETENHTNTDTHTNNTNTNQQPDAQKSKHKIITIPPFLDSSSKKRSHSDPSSSTSTTTNTTTTTTNNNIMKRSKLPPPSSQELKQNHEHDDNSNQDVGPSHKCWIPLTNASSNRYIRAMTVFQQLLPQQQKEKQINPLTDPNQQIQHANYKITWNPIGYSGFLLILMDGVYFIMKSSSATKNNKHHYQVYQLQPTLFIPSPQHPNQQQHRTLLQVLYLKEDTNQDSTVTNIPKVIIQDIIAHNGGIVMNKSWKQRCAYWMDGVLKLKQKQQHANTNIDPIKLRGLEFFPPDQLDHVWEKICPALPYPTNGISLLSTHAHYFNTNANENFTIPVESLQNESFRQDILNRFKSFSS